MLVLLFVSASERAHTRLLLLRHTNALYFPFARCCLRSASLSLFLSSFSRFFPITSAVAAACYIYSLTRRFLLARLLSLSLSFSPPPPFSFTFNICILLAFLLTNSSFPYILSPLRRRSFSRFRRSRVTRWGPSPVYRTVFLRLFLRLGSVAPSSFIQLFA